MTSYLISIVVFALSLTVYVIFENQMKRNKFDIENEGQGQGVEKLNSYHSIKNKISVLYRGYFSEFYLPDIIR